MFYNTYVLGSIITSMDVSDLQAAPPHLLLPRPNARFPTATCGRQSKEADDALDTCFTFTQASDRGTLIRISSAAAYSINNAIDRFARMLDSLHAVGP